MHILIAPNAFKNSLDAGSAAKAIERGLQRSNLVCTCTRFPVGDGGDGTATLLIQHLNGIRTESIVQDPLGRNITASYGLVDNGKTAIIEMADASGLRLLNANEYDPLRATTFGTGQLIAHAIEAGATKIILCIGGSATVDGATGILRALSFRFLDSDRNELSEPASMHLMADYIKPETTILSTVRFVVLCDVLNPLLGENGSAAVFGPQKGARPEDILLLESGLARFQTLILDKNHIDIGTITHGGAAGGIAAGLYGMLDARLENGIDYFLSITGFENEVIKATLVITGEGSLDRQTLEGKAPAGVAKKAKEFNVPVIGFGGKVPDTPDEDLNYYFDRMIGINEPFTLLDDALRNAEANLERAAYRLGMELNAGDRE